MSIQGLVGLPGHGKSYSAIEIFILEALRTKRAIVTNIPLHDDVVKAEFPDSQILQFDLDHAKNDNNVWDTIPGGSLVLLDELWRIWPAGLKPNDIPLRQMSFIKEHRHYLSDDGREMDIVLVTQDLADICSSIRSMIETTIICQKLTALGAKNNFRRDYYRGAVKGFSGPKASFIRSDHGCTYKPDVYKYYKSHTKTDVQLTKGGNTGVVNATIFNSLGFKFGIAAVLLLVCGVIWGVTSTSKKLSNVTKAKDAPVSTLPAVPSTVSPVKPKPSAPADSSRFRLVGNVSIPGRDIYMIKDFTTGKTFHLGPIHCRQDIKIHDITCNYQDQLITRYTGQDSSKSGLVNFQVAQIDSDRFTPKQQ